MPPRAAPGSVVVLRDGHQAKPASANNGASAQRLLVTNATTTTTHWDLSTSAGAGALHTVVSENIHTGVSVASRREVGGTVLNPASHYSVTPQPASEVKAAALAGAGAGKM